MTDTIAVLLIAAVFAALHALSKWLERDVKKAFSQRRRKEVLNKARESVLADRVAAGRWRDAVNGLINAVNRSAPPEVKPCSG